MSNYKAQDFNLDNPVGVRDAVTMLSLEHCTKL